MTPNMSRNTAEASGRLYGIDYLRALNILGTVLLHSWIAYSPAIQDFLSEELKQEIPLIDYATQFRLADLVIILRPTFSMQLMFLISGLFTWKSLDKRGGMGYILHRLSRLGVPFMAGLFILLPMAYYAGSLLDHSQQISFVEYWKNYLQTGPYHGVHFWFLWLLLCFDIALASIYTLVKPFNFTRLKLKQGIALMAFILLCGFLCYFSIVSKTGPFAWLHITGPFYIQLDILPVYFAYFMCGSVLGNIGLKAIFSWPERSVVIYYALALILCSIDLYLALNYLHGSLKSDLNFNIENLNGGSQWIPYGLLASSIGLITIVLAMSSFAIFFKSRIKILDNLQKNSYVIYLIHFTVITWIELIASKLPISPSIRPIVVLIIAIPSNWFVAELLRRFSSRALYYFTLFRSGKQTA